MIISIDAEKAFDKIQHAFLIKGEETIIERSYLIIIKVMYNKPIANNVLNEEILKLFSLKE
jgi:hypothetical protein